MSLPLALNLQLLMWNTLPLQTSRLLCRAHSVGSWAGTYWPGLGHWAVAALNPVVVLTQPSSPTSLPALVYLLITTLHWVPCPLCQLTFGQGHY